MDRVERQLFYGNLSKDLAATTTDLYREIEPLLRAGRLPELMEQVPNLASRLMQTTPAVYLTKQFFNQLMSDVFPYFNDSKHERLEDLYLQVADSMSLPDLIDIFYQSLEKFSE